MDRIYLTKKLYIFSVTKIIKKKKIDLSVTFINESNKTKRHVSHR